MIRYSRAYSDRVVTMVDMGYGMEGVRRSAERQQAAGESAALIARRSVFGTVCSAAAFAAAVAARDAQSRWADAESSRRAGLEVRASTAARVGEPLTADAVSLACPPPPDLPLVVGPPR